MGDTAAPPAPITPERVAQLFIPLYYRVADKMPQRLPQLYGPNSELQHDTHHAIGPEQIARLAHSLPLANAEITVRSFNAQRTGSDSFIVAVIGSFVKQHSPDSSSPATFSQTFVLEKQSDSHNEHFFCRNDLFSIVSSVPENDAVPAPPTPAPVEDATTAPVQATDHLPNDPVESEPASDLDSTPISVPMESRTIAESPPRPHSEANGSADLEEHVEPATTPPSVSIAAPIAETPLADTPVPNGAAAAAAAEETHSTPPSKKTWASIVSSKDDVPIPLPEPIPEQMDSIPQEDPKSLAPARPALPNGHRPPAVPRSGGPRTFGPSAVVQLGALSADKMSDLKNNLRDEFGQYGFKLRNVEVKAGKGIAFIEYDSIEGVKAAVAAWANGPREEGIFAGIPLSVTEKRSTHSNRRPGSVRGGRGGPRGGRRNRPASTPLS